MDVVMVSVAQLVERARGLAEGGGRRLLGITGAPGTGKSTIARAVVDALGPQRSALVPMDGFHLANATLIAWGRRDRKGAWDTFDADGYVHLLRRLRDQTEEYVHAPDFDRDIEESIGSARPVHRDVPLIVTEGNYLLSREGAWSDVAGLLDERWYLELPAATRHERLVLRHEQHGKTHAEAVAWTGGSDEANAMLIAATRDRADLAVTVTP
jgi:pantothenate kinase